jgi:DNA end-binding protein Ku
MAPRSIFNGTIAFGQINVPVKVHSAIEDKGVHFHEVHDKDAAPIEHRRVCPKHGVVPYEEVVRGYEVKPGKYVVLTNEEVAAAAGQRSKTIELNEFVRAAEIDPVFYERTYYLGAGSDGPAGDAYRLLRAALEKAERAAIGRWVFHNREYLVAVRPFDGVLAMHTMRFEDELVPAKDLDLPTPRKKPSQRELEMAQALVDSLHADFDITKFRDTYRQAVLKVIKDKAKGKKIEVPEPEPPDEADADLLAALQATLEQRQKARA